MSDIVQSAPSITTSRRWSLVRRRPIRKQNNLVGYFFISPWLIVFFLFTLAPMVISLGLAFTNYDILSDDYEYVGTANFERMRDDIRYERSVKATVKYVSWVVPFRLSFALAVAMLLNTKRRGVYLYRAAFYAPSIIGGSVAVAVMWRQIFGNAGIVNAFLEILGLETYRWLGDPTRAIWTLIILAVWQFGSPMLIFLAGLKQIPTELYEVASIDGANGLQKFRYVTLPLLTPIIFFNLVMQTIHAFRQFTQAFIISGGTGRPLDTTLLYSLYLYQRAFVNFKMGYAAAMAWVMLLVIAILTLLSFWLSRYWVFYETKET